MVWQDPQDYGFGPILRLHGPRGLTIMSGSWVLRVIGPNREIRCDAYSRFGYDGNPTHPRLTALSVPNLEHKWRSQK